ncbi:MAG TPA: DciA family protein [Actinomycetaceae bacterium]|nr:DciA family protein [Actinomycetaceae bacterium]
MSGTAVSGAGPGPDEAGRTSELEERGTGRLADVDDTAAFQALERARKLAKNPAARRRKYPRTGIAPAGISAGPGLGDAGSGAKPSRRDPQRLGDLAEALLDARGWSEEVESASVITRWREIVGDDIANHTRIEHFAEGRLVVRASSTAWATNLKFLLGQVRSRIAEVVGPEVVTEIVVLGPKAPSWQHGIRSVKGRGPRDTYG